MTAGHGQPGGAQVAGAADLAGAPGHPADHNGSQSERILAARIIDTLLREGYGGLPGRVRRDGGAAVLDLPFGPGGKARALPLEPDGFLADFRLLRTAAGLPAKALNLDEVDALVAAISDHHDRDGVAAFAAECRQALAAIRLRERRRPAALGGLARAWRAAPGLRSGPRGLPGYEALAAGLPHPAYPTSEARLGFGDEDSLRYAPEYRPEFRLCWVAVPRSRLTVAGRPSMPPPDWPTMGETGLPEALALTHDLLPVHPLTFRDRLERSLAEAGLTDQAGGAGAAVPAPGAFLRVTPTLSTRTVAVLGRPGTHLKLPLPASTLGLLNRRSIGPGTLVDGALMQRILAAAVRDDPRLRGLMLADEGSYAHAGHPFLGYLMRRLPAGLDRSRIVPVAALLAPEPGSGSGTGRPLVLDELARWAGHGDPAGLFAAYLRLLFRVQVRLFTRYGLALESHQQNAALVLGPPGGADPAAGNEDVKDAAGPVRLLVKDFDGALVHLPRLTAALGPDAPAAPDFADPRLLTGSDDALADVFTTITVHLCAGALAFGLADQGVAPLPDLLALIRRELSAALDAEAASPSASLLRARVLDADRLPGKSMVTAGTLVAKSRTGASDINKFYGTNGPNYLKDVPMRNRR